MNQLEPQRWQGAPEFWTITRHCGVAGGSNTPTTAGWLPPLDGSLPLSSTALAIVLLAVLNDYGARGHSRPVVQHRWAYVPVLSSCSLFGLVCRSVRSWWSGLAENSVSCLCQRAAAVSRPIAVTISEHFEFAATITNSNLQILCSLYGLNPNSTVVQMCGMETSMIMI